MVLSLKVPHVVFLILLLKNPFDTDRVVRAANHQSNTGMEKVDYKIRPLNKPISAVMSQHT